MSRLALGAIVMSSIVIGCGAVDVTRDELVGIWTVTSASRSCLPAALQKGALKLSLNADGSFSASELPGSLVHSTDEGAPKLITGNGVWKLGWKESSDQVVLEFQSFTLGEPEEGVPFTTYLDVTRDGTAPVMYFWYGDPDSGPRIKFAKGPLRK
jgi:hypothetical protein